MIGIVLIILGIIGKIAHVNTRFSIPNSITTGLFICGFVAVTIQLIITLVVVKKLHKDFL